MITSCYGTIPSDLIRSITVLPLGRNAWLDLLGEGVTILLDKNNFKSDPFSFSTNRPFPEHRFPNAFPNENGPRNPRDFGGIYIVR